MLYVLDHLNRSTASKTAFLKGRNSLRSTSATGRLRATSQAAGHISGYNFETKEASILAVSPSPASNPALACRYSALSTMPQ
jgi:hypothetical protein